MEFDINAAKDIAAIAAPFTGAIVETWLKPKLSAFYKNRKAEREVFEHSLVSKFDEYLRRSVERHSYITTVVFQNQRKLLEELYVPLTVQSAEMSVKMDGYRDEFLPSLKRILLKDTAGMGKSTVLRYLFLSSIRENAGIPIFIELRHLSKERNILDIIHNELNPIDEEFDRAFILKLIRRGDFIFFLDGYDEIPLADRPEVTKDLRTFITKAGANEFIISSREEAALGAFNDFQQFGIQPLSKDEAYKLIENYDQGSGLAEKIKATLEAGAMEEVEPFLGNPLLVSLLYKSYEYKPTIPSKKHIFYRQVYDALFETHDITKGDAFIRQKKSGLDIDAFHYAMRVLGFLTVTKGKIEYDKDELLALISETRKHCTGLTFKETDFLYDLCVTVPLFARDGNFYRWSHKSIQDYFAAQFICMDTKGKQESILRKMAETREFPYRNVLDLCHDIDYRTFRNSLIYDLVRQFIDHYESSYCHFEGKGIAAEDIRLRRSLTFQAFTMIHTGRSEQEDKVRLSEFKAREVVPEGYERMVEIRWPGIRRSSLVAYFPNSYRLISLLRGKEPIFADNDGSTITSPKDVFGVGKVIIVDDGPDSPANQRKVFPVVNKWLSHVRPFHLDIDKCLALKKEIEEDIKRLGETASLISLV